MAFKSNKRSTLSIESPESLFADIKTKRIPGLISHQADLLREYNSDHRETADLAIQLPTGSGKTLVGLLIAEWRRLALKERVVYLCPTRQLVHQVAEQAQTKYGLRVIPFTGKKREYDSKDKLSYESGEAVAVTTYSSLFNINPFFNDPHTIIFDDAHAAESYVASDWTLDIKQYDKKSLPLFYAVAAVLKPHLEQHQYERLVNEAENSGDLSWSEKIPQEILVAMKEELNAVIEANLFKSQVAFPWSRISGMLDRCSLFLGSRSIYIRPYLIPTFSHSPFVNAKQRIYVSATPGEGGELERIFCRRKIERLRPPQGWDRHTIGRRFFVFPELSLEKDEQIDLLTEVANNNRVLLLAGDNLTAEKYTELFQEKSNAVLFNAGDIEVSKDAFTAESSAVAVLANRYDGIDFPEDECRNTVLIDIPTAATPQEKFFIYRLGANRIYDVRILTRIIQAFGRCTRSGTDYGAIFVLGDKLVSFLSKVDRQQFFHPELQGELLFGLDQSREATYDDILDNLDHFLAQDDDWIDAQSEIYAYRDQSQKVDLAGSKCLSEMVVSEVRYMEALWGGDFKEALDQCKTIIGKLSDPALRGERALWNYFAGSLSARLFPGSQGSVEYYKAAAAAAPSVSWLHSLSPKSEEPDAIAENAKSVAEQIDLLEEFLAGLGVSSSRRYDKHEADVRKKLTSEKDFEQGNLELGKFLGFEVGKIESEGSPDPWWKTSKNQLIVFEDHANAEPTSTLSVTKARQAATHKNWIRKNVVLEDDAIITQILVTPVGKVSESAQCHLDDVIVISLESFRQWAISILEFTRSLRKDFNDQGDLFWRSSVTQKLNEKGLTAEKLTENLGAIATKLETSGSD